LGPGPNRGAYRAPTKGRGNAVGHRRARKKGGIKSRSGFARGELTTLGKNRKKGMPTGWAKIKHVTSTGWGGFEDKANLLLSGPLLVSRFGGCGEVSPKGLTKYIRTTVQ